MTDVMETGFLRDSATGALVAKGPNGSGLGAKLLGYAEKIDADFTTTSVTPVDVTGVSVSFTASGRPVWVEFGAYHVKNSAASLIHVRAAEGSTPLSDILHNAAIANTQYPLLKRVRLAGSRLPSVGAHTYKLQADVTGFGTGTLTLTRDAQNPIYLAVFEE